MHTKYYYKRVDVPGGVHDTLVLHQDLLFFGGPVVLKQYRRRNYFVVRADCLRIAIAATILALNVEGDRAQQLAEAALHQTAERFDTFEQAMLYFEMVRA